MKITFIIAKAVAAATLFFLTQTMKAQVSYGINIHGMLNTAEFNSEENLNEDKELKLGYGGGFFVNIPLGSQFMLNASVNYLQKGVKVKQDLTTEEPGISLRSESRMTLGYIEVPLVAVYNLSADANYWFVGAGPSFGYGVGGKAEIFIDGSQDGEDFHLFYKAKPFKDVEEEDGLGMKRFDAAAKVLVGKRIFDKASIQLAYVYGFNNIANRDEYKGDKYKNRSLMLTLAYAFN